MNKMYEKVVDHYNSEVRFLWSRVRHMFLLFLSKTLDQCSSKCANKKLYNMLPFYNNSPNHRNHHAILHLDFGKQRAIPNLEINALVRKYCSE